MEYHEITKTEFKDSYNIVKVLILKEEIMEFAKTIKNDNKQAVAFAIRKKRKLTLEDRMTSLEEKFDLILNEIKDIKNRLDRNNIF